MGKQELQIREGEFINFLRHYVWIWYTNNLYCSRWCGLPVASCSQIYNILTQTLYGREKIVIELRVNVERTKNTTKR